MHRILVNLKEMEQDIAVLINSVDDDETNKVLTGYLETFQKSVDNIYELLFRALKEID